VSVASHGVTGGMLSSNLSYSGNMTVSGTQAVSSGGTSGSFRVQTSGKTLLMDGQNIGTTAGVLHINQNGGDSTSTVLHGPVFTTSTLTVGGAVQAEYLQKTCSGVQNCTCPTGTQILSGGAYAKSGYTLRRSEPASDFSWVAFDDSSSATPYAIRIICARITQDPSF